MYTKQIHRSTEDGVHVCRKYDENKQKRLYSQYNVLEFNGMKFYNIMFKYYAKISVIRAHVLIELNIPVHFRTTMH